ncbi:hypothetical protein BH11ACT4_BH11ACT4_24850 [soil metagenome]
MTVLALLLAGIGLADAAGSQVTTTGRARTLVALATGALVVAIGTWGTGLAWGWGLVVFALLALWVTATTDGSTSVPAARAAASLRAYPWSVIGLAAAVAALLALSPRLPAASGWLTDWYATLQLGALAGVPFAKFALGVGSVAFLIESANLLVRMVLVSSLDPDAKPEAQLKGGRILGPIERVFIFAMALTGQFLAISAIVAAKSILRFPEVSNDEKRSGGGSAAEYVLVGSFVSWAVALLLVGIVALS